MVDRLPFATAPMAFVSDVHGNLPALEAVLSELDRQGVEQLFAAGDHLLGGEDPLGVWRLLQARKAHLTVGVSDVALTRIAPDQLAPSTAEEQARAAHFTQTREAVGDLIVEQLRRLPALVRVPLVSGGELVMVHGSPLDPMTEIGHDASDDELLALLGDDPADVVVCGGTHVPFQRAVEGVLFVNVGSVGAAPEGRIAHYGVVEPKIEGPEIRLSWIEY